MLKRAISIGIENYKEMISRKYYYVDKTLMIKELLDRQGKVNLFMRPRRFGKTLTLSMMRTFFERDMDETGRTADNRGYFEGMKIMEAGEAYTGKLGRYPVIDLSLKSAKQPEYGMAYDCIRDEIIKEYQRHRYVLDGAVLLDLQKEKYLAIMNERAEAAAYAKSLAFLSECLRAYHNENVIVLIDEYDVPLENAYFCGFYDEMVGFIRSLFESALKTNDNLEFAVITGCLRISRESIFTGLNNLKIVSILNESYAEYFGFTQSEVEGMLGYYELSGMTDDVKKWYDGYLFGDTEVYNPWSILNYVDEMRQGDTRYPRPYWSNTSSNSIIRELVENAQIGVRREIEDLISGGQIEKPIHEDITYEDVLRTQDNLWNFLFFTGYLKKVSQRFEDDTLYLTLAIPNMEIRYIYRNTIREWFDVKMKQTERAPLYKALLAGDSETFEILLKKLLLGSISYYDSAEKFYHGFLLGVLSGMDAYYPQSNRESGDGRPDILLTPVDEQQPVIIFELKKADSPIDMDTKCDEALRQIEEKRYDAELLAEGYLKILKYGICFCKKSCRVKICRKEETL